MNERLALGTVQFGLSYGIANQSGTVSQEDVGQILSMASKAGINTMDTAIAYGNSENKLGETGVTDWKIVSKLPGIPEQCDDIVQWAKIQIQQSLGRLGVNRLYAVLLHRPDQLFEEHGFQLLEALKNLKQLNLTEKVGVSIYSPNELDRLFDLCHFDLVQAPLNILDRRLIDSNWAKKLKASGVEIHTRSAFLQGLLLMPAVLRPTKFNRWNNLWSEWDHWLADTGVSALDACLQYPLSVSEIDKIVIGVDSPAHLQEIISATKTPVSDFPHWQQFIDENLINPAGWSQL